MTTTHTLQRLTATPITGPTPERDPEFGVVYRILEEYEANREDIEFEVHHDGIELVAEPPQVFLTLKGKRKVKTERVATLAMTGYHVDDHLVVLDPDYTGRLSGAPAWTPWS